MKFSVTYEKVFHSEEPDQEPEIESGFIVENVTLAEALSYFGEINRYSGKVHGDIHADSWPISECSPPRWFTHYGYNEGTHEYYAECDESRSLHLPDDIQPETAMRIARLLTVAF